MPEDSESIWESNTRLFRKNSFEHKNMIRYNTDRHCAICRSGYFPDAVRACPYMGEYRAIAGIDTDGGKDKCQIMILQ